jgi:hypothetical protein
LRAKGVGVDWIDLAHKLITAGVVIAFFLFRTGRAFGAREKTVDVKLEEIQRFDARLAEIRTFVMDAGKRMSDKVTELQGFLSKAELLLRDVSELQRDNEKVGEMVGMLRERIARCEARQWQQAGRWEGIS